ncbi:BN159_2729 family protein [Streptomyces tagetis]|uniref:BN159_2729 family protein n=1 Tax=Streptomyces tagetis TaxID=2820809 RepID=A0A941B2X9_9ACTN|nr:BN159_2729 family protein [Streptomyces sp. RG38]MBQ0827652.1 BN159_2729 family protein [Streptomyces sp. RG38]
MIRELTDLERQALAWDAACERANRVAADIALRLSEDSPLHRVQVDGDQLLVALYITAQSQWAAWRRYFGITHAGERALPYVVCADGHRGGVQVWVAAYDLPETRAREAASARRPFELDGIVYDLAVPLGDTQGDTWFFQGEVRADGMPLLSQDGRPERCSLANIVSQAGPLTRVRDTSADPVMPVLAEGAEGGGAA